MQSRSSDLQSFIKTKREEQNLDKNLKKSIKVTPPRTKISGEEFVEIERIPCKNCSRRFYPKKTLEKHEQTCQKTQKKRETFDSSRQRLTENMLEISIKKLTESMKYEDIERKPCKHCSRLFELKRIQKHEKICQKSQKKRETFDSKTQRAPQKSESKEGRQTCKYCLRKFDITRISRHENICEQANTKKRQIFDSQKMRLKGVKSPSKEIDLKKLEERQFTNNEDLYLTIYGDGKDLDMEKTLIILNTHRYYQMENIKEIKKVLKFYKDYILKNPQETDIDIDWINLGYLQYEYLLDTVLEIMDIWTDMFVKNTTNVRNQTLLIYTLFSGKISTTKKPLIDKYRALLWRVYELTTDKAKIQNIMMTKMNTLKTKPSTNIQTELELLSKIIKTHGAKTLKNQLRLVNILAMAYDKGSREEKDYIQEIFTEIYNQLGKVVLLQVDKYGNNVLKRLKINEEQAKEEKKTKKEEMKKEFKEVKKALKENKPLKQKEKMGKIMTDSKNIFSYDKDMTAKLIKEAYTMYIIKEDATHLQKLAKDIKDLKEKEKLQTVWDETMKLLENPNQLIVIQTMKSLKVLVNNLKSTIKGKLPDTIVEKVFTLFKEENMPTVKLLLSSIYKNDITPFKQFQYNFFNLQERQSLKESETINLYKLMQEIYAKKAKDTKTEEVSKEDVGMFQTVLYQKQYDCSSTLKANQLNLIALMLFNLQNSKQVIDMVTMTIKDLDKKLIDKNLTKIALRELYSAKKNKTGDMDKLMAKWKGNLKDFNISVTMSSS